MLNLIPDTNVLLHYKSLSMINATDLGFAEEFRWVITENVLWEVDNKKWDDSKRLRQRAKTQLNEIEQAGESGTLPNGIAVLVYHRTRTDYVARNLDPVRPDHRVIADIIDFRETHSEEAIIVLTADHTMKSALLARSFATRKPPKSLLLPELLDETDLEVDRLRKRVRELEDDQPNLTLVTPDETDSIVCCGTALTDR